MLPKLSTNEYVDYSGLGETYALTIIDLCNYVIYILYLYKILYFMDLKWNENK